MRARYRAVWTRTVLACALWSAAPGPCSAQPPAVRVDPIAAILDAYQTHEIVALGAAHGNERGHAFLLTLIRDPRFPGVVDDIVVEFGNARYQDLADRYVGGDDVPAEQLRLIWRDAVTPSAFEDAGPVDVLRAVREINMSLPSKRRLRVLLGDPPIDWARIHRREEHWKWVEMRDAYPAALIRMEVLAKQHKALVVYGGGHLQRKQMLTNFDMSSWQAQTLVSLLEASGPVRIFIVWPTSRLFEIQPDLSAWRAPGVALVRGTQLGAIDIVKYWEDNPMAATRFSMENGAMAPIPRDTWRPLRAEEQFDAVLYLGPPSAMTERPWSREICADTAFIRTRLERYAIAGLPPAEADRLKAHCSGTGGN